MSDMPIFDPETGQVLGDGGAMPPSPRALSLDEARALLVREHGVAIGSDDPILMLITLHQAMIADYATMLSGHDDKIKGFLGATGEACVQAVSAVLASLKDKTVKASLDQAFALVERQEQAMERLRVQLRNHRIVISVLTMLSVAGSSLALTLLFILVR